MVQREKLSEGDKNMNGDKLFEYMERFAEKSNTAIQAMRTSEGVGFAIPIPKEATPEAKEDVQMRLSKLRWSFNQCTIGHREYYVLFPFGQ